MAASGTASDVKTRVFISYSRTDMEFANSIDAALRSQGIETLIDRNAIGDLENWRKRIGDLIAQSDAVVFILSPAAVASKECRKEVTFAASLNKRFAPIVFRPVESETVPEAIASINRIDFIAAPFEATVERLVLALETDIAWVRKHTEFGELARRWDGAGRPGPGGLVLRPPLLEEAERWIERQPNRAPEPTEATRSFIAASRIAYNEEEAQKKAAVDRILLSESRHLSDLANESIRAGDASAAILMALAALPGPDDRFPRPYLAEAESTLSAAIHAPRDMVVLKGHRGWLHDVHFSPDGLRVLTQPAQEAPRLYDARTGREIAVLGEHDTTPHAAAFDPSDRFIVTACHDHMLRLWNAATGQFIANLSGHAGPVRSAAFTRDGKFLVSGSDDETVRLWDTETAREVGRLGDGLRASRAVLSPDGKTLALLCWSKVVFFRTDTWQELRRLEGHKEWIEAIAFSPDSVYFATGSRDRTARLWSMALGEEIARLEDHRDHVSVVGFNPDGRRLITGAHDNTARIWECPGGKEIAILSGHKGWVTAAAFSPDGRFAMTASFDKTIRIWDGASGKELAVLGGHDALINGALISPDSRLVASASFDWTARIWTVWGSAGNTLLGHNSNIRIARFSPDGSLVATASADNTARLWDAKTGENVAVLARHGDVVWDVAFSPDGTRLVSSSSDKTAIIWDVKTATHVATLQGHSDAVLCAQFSPDGKKIVTASDDNTAIIWNRGGGARPVALEGHLRRIVVASFSPDSGRVLTLSGAMITPSTDDSVRLWDTQSGRQIAMFRAMGPPMSAAFSPDGRYIAIGYGGILEHQCIAEVWSCETFKRMAVLEGHQRPICGIAFSADGHTILTASFDHTARLWDARAGKQIGELRGHGDIVRSAAFADDGRRIVTASKDRTARVWDAATHQEIAVLRGHTDEVRSAFMNPAADQVLTASYDNTARLWQVFKSTDASVDFARTSVARALTREQLQAAFHDVVPPEWYVESKKWPYDTEEWQSWLAAKKAGGNVEVPVPRFMKYG